MASFRGISGSTGIVGAFRYKQSALMLVLRKSFSLQTSQQMMACSMPFRRGVSLGFLVRAWQMRLICGPKCVVNFVWDLLNDNRVLCSCVERVREIEAREQLFRSLSERELSAKSQEIYSRHITGDSLDSLLPDAFALVREATFRKLGKRHYEVQLAGGVVLHEGAIAEMATGEGKSLTGILPAYLNALPGDSVFMVTVNDYLAQRDAQLFEPVFTLLGMKVWPPPLILPTGHCNKIPSSTTTAFVQVTYALASMTDSERRESYAEGAVVYATAQTLAFDYLRDSSCQVPESLLLPSTFGHVIIDEVDQVLIDNALNPSITSGPDDADTDVIFERIEKAAAVAQGLVSKQLGVALGAAQQNGALIQHLGTVLAGVGVDVASNTTLEHVQTVYEELSQLSHTALGRMPATLCALTVYQRHETCGVVVGLHPRCSCVAVLMRCDAHALAHPTPAAVVVHLTCAQMHATPLRQRARWPSDARIFCRDLFQYDADSKRVKVTKLGFACAAQSLRVLWRVGPEDWDTQMWGSYICKALDAALVYVPAVDYAITASPRTGKQDVLLIDQSTSEPPRPLCNAPAATLPLRPRICQVSWW